MVGWTGFEHGFSSHALGQEVKCIVVYISDTSAKWRTSQMIAFAACSIGIKQSVTCWAVCSPRLRSVERNDNTVSFSAASLSGNGDDRHESSSASYLLLVKTHVNFLSILQKFAQGHLTINQFGLDLL